MLAAGINAVVSAPIRRGDIVLGSLNVYSDRPLPVGTGPAAAVLAARAATAIA